ncbi:MAG: hypothetical protein WBL80_00570, partial [Erysipelotrichaceae bacterium]
MKFKKPVLILVGIVIVLSAVCSVLGLTFGGNGNPREFLSIGGETIKIFGSGLYKNDSLSVVAQGKASDLVTLVFAIPLLMVSLVQSYQGSIKARLIMTGTLGYFLYTYMSYTFLWMYNPLFIVYVLLMSASLFAFILAILSFDNEKIPALFSEKLPVRFLGGFQLFIAFAIGMLWLGKIAPTILNGTIPVGLEHYTTLVIQGMDLGFVVPAAVLSGILLIKRKPLGYLLSSVIIIKGITMLTCISAMIINSYLSGIE